MEIEAIKSKYGFEKDAADPTLAKAIKDVRKGQVLVNEVRNAVMAGKIKVGPKAKDALVNLGMEVYTNCSRILDAMKKYAATPK